MRGDAAQIEQGGNTTALLRGVALLSTALIALAVLLTGCGGNAPTGSVASLGSRASTTSTTSSTAAGPNEGGESSPGSQAVAYSACMRSHGVANFPDPQISHNGNSTSVKIAIPAGSNFKGNPKLRSADQACRKLLPNAGNQVNPPTLTPAQQAQYLKAAACIRSHGVPNFPDPTFSGGGVHLAHQGLNESSPAFKAAVQACESLIPGGVHGGAGHAQEAAPRPAP